MAIAVAMVVALAWLLASLTAMLLTAVYWLVVVVLALAVTPVVLIARLVTHEQEEVQNEDHSRSLERHRPRR